MKLNHIILITLLLITHGIQSKELNEFLITDNEIHIILSKSIKDKKKYGFVKNNIIVLEADSLKNETEIRIGFIEKEKFNLFLQNKQDKPVGFFRFEEFLVIVFTERKLSFLTRTNKKENFSFFDTKNEFAFKEQNYPIKPIIFEPIVWIYHYNNKKFKLIDIGRFGLLD